MMDSCFRKELAVMKDKIRNLKDGCWQHCVQRGRYFCSATATHFGGMNDIFIPRKMEFKGWVADHSEGAFRVLQTMQLRNF